MTLKAKLISLIVFEVAFIVLTGGWFTYRESKWRVKDLAKDLLVAKTDQAFALCDRHYKNSLEPSEELKQEIAAVKIAKDGYIAVIDNDSSRKGVLIVHPTDVGKPLYNDQFPHIKAVLDEIDAHHDANGYANFTVYKQGTNAKGRQGEKKIGYYKYFAPWKWVIMSTGYEKDVFASREQLKKTLFQIVVVVLVIGIFTIYLTIRQMFKPVQRLTESTKEVARGNWNISIDYHSNDEIGTLAQSFNQMVQSLRENASIWHEFQVARDMQYQMLPKRYPDIEGIELSAKSIPAKEVGGDFYDFLTLKDDCLGLVVGDVSGHGVSAAMIMTAAMGAVRFASEEKDSTNEVLTMVNTRLNKDIQNHMFVALFYAIFDPKTQKLFYTNAGQTMPFLLRDDKISFLPQAEEGDRFPLGIVPSTTYEQMSIQLKTGDMLVFYTDGIVDAMNGTYENYGFDRFANSIRECAAVESESMVTQLIKKMEMYRGKTNHHDDVTLVILKVT